MPTPLLKTYGFSTDTDSGEFLFSFDIPNNCNYSVAFDATKNIYTVSIQLNSGQSQPSNTYTTETYSFDSTAGLLDVRFQETCNGATVKRPKLSIDGNNH